MKRVSSAVLFLFFLGQVLQADLVKRGQAGFRFLEHPVSAEAIGRGGLGLTLIHNSNAVYWNPSGIGWLDSRFDLAANRTLGIADIDYNTVAFSFRLGNKSVLALDVLDMDYGELVGTRRADNEQGYVETGTFSPDAYSVGITFSQKVSDRFSYGVRTKYAYQYLGSPWVSLEGKSIDDTSLVIGTKKYSLGEMALDIGVTYDFLVNGVRFGAVLQNFSRETKYARDKFPLPFNVGFSLSLSPLSLVPGGTGGNNLMVGLETIHARDFREKVKFGAEYLYGDMLILRSGYMGNYDERGFTAGVGMRSSLSSMNIRLDYAYEAFGIFGPVHTVSLGLGY